MTTEEIWKVIPEYEEYQVSNLGNFKRKDGKLSEIKPNKRTGYVVVSLYLGCKNIVYTPLHVLIAKTFIVNDNPEEKIIVNHIDGNKSNNMISNLEYVTPKENANKKIYKKEPYTRSIIKSNIDGTIIKEWKSLKDAAIESGVKESNIRYACKFHSASTGFLWRYGSKSKHNNEDIEEEKWTTGKYKEIELTVSNKGRIVTLSGGKTYGSTKNGYKYTRICSDKKLYPIHQIICTIFNGKPPTEKHIVNHIDNNGLNNCPNNLAWVTYSENTKHANQINPKPANTHNNKSVEQYSLDGKYITRFQSIKLASKTLGINPSSISSVCKKGKHKTAGGFIWKYGVPEKN